MKRLILSLILLALSVPTFSADPVWKQRTGSERLDDVVFADGRFVAVNILSSSIYISADGKQWEVFEKGDGHAFRDITYGNGRYVAVGSFGDYGYSLDGIEWITGSGIRLYDVAFGNGTFVAIGLDGAVSTSPDGEVWTARTSGTVEDFSSLIFADNEFVAVGRNKTMIHSSDGINWQAVIQDASSALSGSSYYNIGYVDGRYYLKTISADYTAVSISNWSITGVDTGRNQGSMSVAADGFTFVNYRGQYSADGLIWTLPIYDDTRAIAYGNGAFVIVGDTGLIYSSEDGINWQQQGGNSLQVLERGAIIFAEGRFVYSRPSSSIRFSYDGLQLDHSTLVLGTNDSFQDIHYNGSLYIAVTGDGAIYSSDDALVWTERLPEDDTRNFLAVASGGGRYVAVGYQGAVFSSADGLSWSDVAPAVTGTKTLNSVTHGSRGFVVAGSSGALFTSPDGLVWTAATSGTSSSLTKVVYGHGIYVVVGASGTHLSSVDAVNWANTDTGSRDFTDVTVTNTGFVAVGSRHTVSSSTDGVSWKDIGISTSLAKLYKVVSAGGAVFAYGVSRNFTLGDFVPGSMAETPPALQVQDRHSEYGAYDMAFGNGRFVVVGGGWTAGSSGGSKPQVMVSVDGKQWRMNYDIPYQAKSILFQNGRFIAVWNDDNSDTVGFLYSLDGLTWTTGNIYDDMGNVSHLEYRHGVYFGIGTNGLILTSTDGNDWVVSNPESASTSYLEGISYIDDVDDIGGRYLVSGAANTALISDDDGISWTRYTTVQDNGDETTTEISLRKAYASGRFYGYSSAGRHSSSDGITWSLPVKLTLTDEEGTLTKDLGTLDAIGLIGRLEYAHGLHINFTGSGYVTTSSNGVNWTRRPGDFGVDRSFSVAYGNNTLVLMSWNGLDSLTSIDNGLNWQRRHPWRGTAIRYLNGNLIRGFGGSVQISTDLGKTWRNYYKVTNPVDEPNISSPSLLTDFAFGNNTYVAVGFKNNAALAPTLFSSLDARSWIDHGGLDLHLNSVIYADGLFVAVGDDGVIRTSADGVNWDSQSSGTTENLEEVTWGHTGFIAVGYNNVILTSPDAITWTAQSAPADTNYTAVGYRAGIYIVSGKNQLLRSTDGVSWTLQLLVSASSSSGVFSSIAEGPLGFIASGNIVGTWQSTDAGATWWEVSDKITRDGDDLIQAGGRVFFSSAMNNRNDGITAIDKIPTTGDSDGDGIPDTTDNCPDDSNSDQLNNDGDTQGNVCDAYPDDAYDNAPPPSPTITVTLPDGRRVTGTVFTFIAEGFKPFSLVQAYIQSDPIFVGEEIADKDGKVSFTIVLPLELPLGDHTLLLMGTNYDGSERQLTNPIKIELPETIFRSNFE